MELARSLHIDGSLLEGGGQILRNASALAAITGSSIQVDKIRAGRSKPGLSPQHLTGLQLVANITGGNLVGAAIRSSSISLSPGPSPPQAGTYEADTKTAGSCTLMVQQSLPVLLFARSNDEGNAHDRPNKRVKGTFTSCLTLRGGTDAAFAPPMGYLQHIFIPTFKQLTGPQCNGLSLELFKRGFYPQGGGVAQLLVPALPPNTPLPSWELTQRGYLVSITGYAVTAGKIRPDIGQRMATAAKHGLQSALKDATVLFGPPLQASSSSKVTTSSSAATASSSTAVEQAKISRSPSSIPSVVVDIQAVQEPPDRAVGNGGSILLVAETSTGCLFGASAIAERGVTAEAVGAMAARDLLEELRGGAAVDRWMQDQLIIFMALASGRSSMLCGELTLHTRTAISIAEQLLPAVKFDISTVSIVPNAGEAASSGQSATAPQLLYLVQCTGAGIVSQSGAVNQG